MALVKQTPPRTMDFGEHRDLKKIVGNSPSDKQKRVNVNFDEELHVRFKAACARKGTSITDVIKELVHEWMVQNDKN